AQTRGLLQGSRAMVRHFINRRIVDVPDGRRALFLAPHPDDIEIGCAGTLLKMIAAGREVRLVYLTDGSAVGTPERDAHFAEVRRLEAEAVSARLGLPAPVILGYPERSFRDPGQRAQRAADLGALLDDFGPDSVFLPWITDQHPDHRYTNVLLADALRASSHRPTVCGYEVWSFVPPGLVVDISRQLDEKIEIIRLYRSQFEFHDYAYIVDTIGRSHAPLVPGAVACEAFCAMSAEGFLQTEAELALDDPADCDEVLLTPPPTLP
ncbi:MAG: PIG-L family deacetylase, partial [Planctomycetes bacterium]|nr:PIG-L family deacetylase [Planctomycetota bacterium]